MNICFQAEQRKPLNRNGLKRLRQEGRLPGIIMGLNKDSTMIHLSTKEFHRWVRGGGTGVLNISLGESETIPVLLEAVQRDVVTRDYLHADFLRISKNEVVRTKIPIVYVGTAKGSKLGGIVQTQSSFIEVQALPRQLPASITVDISDLDIGESLHVGDIKLPADVILISGVNELLVSIVVMPKVVEELEE